MKSVRYFVGIVAALATLVLAGCLSSGGGGGGPPKDFGDNDPNVVVCLGDSITEGRCVPAGAPYPSRLASLSGKNVINAGTCGEKSAIGVSKVGGLLDRYSPGYLVILYGANDAIFGLDVNVVINNLRNIIGAAQANKTIPLIGTVLPIYDSRAFAEPKAAEYSNAIRSLAKETGAILVDFRKEFGNERSFIQADGLHPSDSGKALMALAVNDRL